MVVQPGQARGGGHDGEDQVRLVVVGHALQDLQSPQPSTVRSTVCPSPSLPHRQDGWQREPARTVMREQPRSSAMCWKQAIPVGIAGERPCLSAHPGKAGAGNKERMSSLSQLVRNFHHCTCATRSRPMPVSMLRFASGVSWPSGPRLLSMKTRL